MNKVAALLDRLGITEDGYVSLTNLLTYAVLVKLALAPAVGVGEISALAGVLLSHLGHHALDTKQPVVDSQATAALADMQTKLAALQLGQQMTSRR